MTIDELFSRVVLERTLNHTIPLSQTEAKLPVKVQIGDGQLVDIEGVEFDWQWGVVILTTDL